MKRLFNKIRSNKGNSLAEFAVTAAMMATLATTAAPRFSGVGDAGKANQTKQNLDKIGGMVNQFFMNTSAPYSSLQIVLEKVKVAYRDKQSMMFK